MTADAKTQPTGETDLATLLGQMAPRLHAGEFVFCVLEAAEPQLIEAAIGWFREEEGVTVILPRAHADALGLPYGFVAAWITLQVHSSLAAVGLSAAVTRALADAGISANVVAAYHHDHLFVPAPDALRALTVLQSLVTAAPLSPRST